MSSPWKDNFVFHRIKVKRLVVLSLYGRFSPIKLPCERHMWGERAHHARASVVICLILRRHLGTNSTLTSYKSQMGRETTARVKTSEVGVMMAATTTIATTAWRR